MKTAELEGAQLDLAVANADELPHTDIRDGRCYAAQPIFDGQKMAVLPFEPSTRWAHGGPLIEREQIAIASFDDGWCAEAPTRRGAAWFYRGEDSWGPPAPTPLIAAMRAFVASRLGEEVELP